jgi:hypothetical protein
VDEGAARRRERRIQNSISTTIISTIRPTGGGRDQAERGFTAHFGSVSPAAIVHTALTASPAPITVAPPACWG